MLTSLDEEGGIKEHQSSEDGETFAVIVKTTMNPDQCYWEVFREFLWICILITPLNRVEQRDSSEKKI